MTGIRTIDLFAGAGGFSLGLQRAGPFTIERAVEIDRDSAATFLLNFPRSEVIVDDVRKVDFKEMKAELVVGGPPCQGFSRLNRNREGDPRNCLSGEMVRCVLEVRPKFVVLENVPGFLDGPEWEHVRGTLTNAGYAMRSDVVNAADFGVPQRRKRALVICAAEGHALPWPVATHSAKGDSLPPHRTVGDAFALLAEEPDGKNWHRDAERDQAVHGERFRSVREGGSRKDLPADLVLDCWKDTRGYSDVLGRLEWHRPSTTVRTEFFRPEKGRFLHPSADRPITPREAARLQSFPDSFRLPEDHTLTSVGRQIGNAMPPALAAAIGRAVLSSAKSGRTRSRTGSVAA